MSSKKKKNNKKKSQNQTKIQTQNVSKSQVQSKDETPKAKEKKTSALTWKIVSAALAVALIAVCCTWGFTANNCGGGSSACSSSSSESVKEEADALSLWTESAPLKAELTDYVKAVTDKDNKDAFIPVERRIAVFDMDGTLCCETDPGYFDHKLLYHRVMEDPDYKDKASDEEKETAAIIKEYFDTGKYPEGLDVRHGKAVATAFKGMTVDEFDAYVKAYRDTPMDGYTNMTNGQAFYKPMLQVVEYLQANDFKVYIISGTDRLITRGLCDGVINIPLAQMIGSDESFVATNQGSEDGLKYTFSHEDKLITGGEFLIKNLKMNKVSAIEREIGLRPVLCFGNSSGDGAMANYTITDNEYKSGAYLLCCDDLERENGNIEKADKMRKSCEENGWTAVSMKDDWTTIYGDGVSRK